MNFEWTPEQLVVRKKVEAVFAGAAPEFDALEQADAGAIQATVRKALRLLAETGYLELAQGEAAQLPMLIAAQEVVAQASSSLFLAVETTARLFGGLLAQAAPAWADELLAPLRRGELIAGVALSESESKEAPGPQTIATAVDGGFTINGRKSFVTNAPIADVLAVTVGLDEQPAVAIINARDAGVTIGPRLKTLGYQGLTVSALTLEDVRVPANRFIGPLPDGKLADKLLLTEALVLTQASVGLAQQLYKTAVSHAKRHRRGGRAIIKYQEVGFKLAEILTQVQSAQLLGYRAGWLAARGDAEAATVMHCAKVFASETAEQVAAKAMQILAGEGYLWGNRVERGFRDAKYAALAGLSSEQARMTVADNILTLYRV